MEYYKVYRGGTLIGVESSPDPAFVKWQERNNMIILCSKEEAEAIVSDKDGETVFLLPGKQLHGVETDLSAVLVTQAEYEEALGDLDPLPDPEDEDPEIPDGTPEEEVLTRAQLTERVAELTRLVKTEAQPFTATRSYQTGEIITDGSRVYVADQVIVTGETVRPGINCTETNLAELLTALQAQHEE